MPKMYGNFLKFTVVSIFFFVTACTSQPQPPTPMPTPTTPYLPTIASIAEEGILGRWSGLDNNNEVTFLFDSDGRVTLSYLGALHGGTYTLNEQTNPMQLDFVWDDIGTVMTILEFVDENTIRFENNYPEIDRPSAFSDFVTLTRTK